MNLKIYFYILILLSSVSHADEVPVDGVYSTSAPVHPVTDSAPPQGTGDFNLVQRATSLNSKQVEMDMGDRSSNGAQLKIRYGLGKGFDLYALGAGRSQSLKPGGGIQWQFLGNDHGPLSMALASQFRKGGFSEPNGEGEMDLEWIGTYKFGQSEISANFLGGSDLDGETRIFEARVAAAHKLSTHFKGGLECESRWSSRTSSVDAGADSDDPGVSSQPVGNVTTFFVGPMVQFHLAPLTITGSVGYGSDAQYSPGPEVRSSGAAGAFKASYDF